MIISYTYGAYNRQFGFNICGEDANGMTALDLARRWNKPAAVKLPALAA